MKKIILSAYILFLPFQLRVPQGMSGLLMNSFLFIMLAMLIFSKKEKHVGMKFDVPLILFLCVWSFSVIFILLNNLQFWGMPSWDILKEFKRLITLVLGYVVFSLLIRDQKEADWYLDVFVFSIIIVGLHTMRSGVLGGIHFGDHKRASGPFGVGFQASDVAGGFLATFTPFVLTYFFFIKNKIKKMSALAGFFVCCLGLMATYSRGSMLALTLAISVVTLISFKPLIRKSNVYGFFIFVCFVLAGLNWQTWVPPSIVNRVQGTTISSHDEDVRFDQSSEERLDKWKNGIDVFKTNPILGIGYKQLQHQFGTDPHNTFIQITAEMGIFGILFFFLFLLQVFREALVLRKIGNLSVSIGMIGCLVSFMIVNMFYSNFFRDTVTGSLWVIFGIAAALKRLNKENLPS